MTGPHYLPHVDGLRALAVAGVVLYHFGADRELPGGFTGVDVFFVISGFVITRLVTKELEERRFFFAQFYKRRLFRILPALIVTIVLVAPAMWLFASPNKLAAFAPSAIAAALSVSNIWFWSETGYFDAGAETKPLLHTWSLGVEEQFYLLWPALLVAVVGWDARRRVTHLGLAFAVLLIAGVLASWHVSIRHPDLAFYGMPFRVFEFVLGAIVTLLPRIKTQALAEAAAVTGLLAVFAAFTLIDERTPFPGWAALVPCGGAAMFVWSGGQAATARLLTNGPALFIGRISYSLYLVHWPLAVFWHQFYGKPHGIFAPAVLLTVSSGLAYLMYRLVERPMRVLGREKATPRLRAAAFGLGAATAGIAAVAGLLMSGAIGPASLADVKVHITMSRLSAEKKKRNAVFKRRCGNLQQNQCLGPPPADRNGGLNVLIVGDSHAIDALNAFDAAFPQFIYRISSLGGCPPTRDIRALVAPRFPALAECEALNKERFSKSALDNVDVVVISVLSGWFKPEHATGYFDFLASHARIKVIVIGNYLALKRDLADIMLEPGYAGKQSILAQVQSRFAGEDGYRELERRYGFLFISKKDAFCRSECPLFDDNDFPFTWDKDHLSWEFSRRLGQFMAPGVARHLGIAP